MAHHFDPNEEAAPPLSDEAVVYIHNALSHYLSRFESRSAAQIQRHYQDRAKENLLPPGTATPCRPGEDPF
jgi:hypothetical protein